MGLRRSASLRSSVISVHLSAMQTGERRKSNVRLLKDWDLLPLI